MNGFSLGGKTPVRGLRLLTDCMDSDHTRMRVWNIHPYSYSSVIPYLFAESVRFNGAPLQCMVKLENEIVYVHSGIDRVDPSELNGCDMLFVQVGMVQFILISDFKVRGCRAGFRYNLGLSIIDHNSFMMVIGKIAYAVQLATACIVCPPSACFLDWNKWCGWDMIVRADGWSYQGLIPFDQAIRFDHSDQTFSFDSGNGLIKRIHAQELILDNVKKFCLFARTQAKSYSDISGTFQLSLDEVPSVTKESDLEQDIRPVYDDDYDLTL